MAARRVSHSRVTPALQVPPSMAANVSEGCGQEDYGKEDGGTGSQCSELLRRGELTP
jgi:hypothetical protein